MMAGKLTMKRQDLLNQVKQGFVPMPGGQQQPVAGASEMTEAMGAPMGPEGGMDPMAGGMPPMDPMAGGMPPMDPMMGMAPPEDMLAGGEPMPGQITMSIPEFLELVTILQGGAEAKSVKESEGKSVSGKLDRITAALQQAGLGV